MVMQVIISISLLLYLTAEIFIPPLSVTSGCTEHPTLRHATPLPSKQRHSLPYCGDFHSAA